MLTASMNDRRYTAAAPETPKTDIEVPAASGHADPFRIDQLCRLDLVAPRTKQFSGGHPELVAGGIDCLQNASDVVAFQVRVGVAEKDQLSARVADGLI